MLASIRHFGYPEGLEHQKKEQGSHPGDVKLTAWLPEDVRAECIVIIQAGRRIPEEVLVLRSLNPVIKDPAPGAVGGRRSPPDPRFGTGVELGSGHTPGQVNLARVSKTLTSERIPAEEPPPALLEIEPAGAFGDEDVLQPWMLRHPGARLQAVVTTQVIRDEEDVTARIVLLDELEQFNVIGGVT